MLLSTTYWLSIQPRTPAGDTISWIFTGRMAKRDRLHRTTREFNRAKSCLSFCSPIKSDKEPATKAEVKMRVRWGERGDRVTEENGVRRNVSYLNFKFYILRLPPPLLPIPYPFAPGPIAPTTIYFNPLVRENVTSVVVQRRSEEAEVCGTPVARNFHDIVGEVINARNKWEQLPLRSHLIFWADFKFGQNGSRSRDRTLLISIRTLYIS